MHRNYRVLVNGQNFLISLDGEPQKLGFYTTRYVKAVAPTEAEEMVIEMLRRDPKLIGITINGAEDMPMLYVEEIEPVQKLSKPTGFGFYLMDEDDE